MPGGGSLFFFKQKTAYEMRISDWSSDVCSSDLRVLVTTDDEAIRAAAEAAGAWTPFMRDPGLAEDLTPTEPVLKDALERAEAIDGGFGIVVFLQPTEDRKSTRLNSSH